MLCRSVLLGLHTRRSHRRHTGGNVDMPQYRSTLASSAVDADIILSTMTRDRRDKGAAAHRAGTEYISAAACA